jgi:hypothetical protein
MYSAKGLMPMAEDAARNDLLGRQFDRVRVLQQCISISRVVEGRTALQAFPELPCRWD